MLAMIFSHFEAFLSDAKKKKSLLMLHLTIMLKILCLRLGPNVWKFVILQVTYENN